MGIIGLVSTMAALMSSVFALSTMNHYVVTYQGQVVSQPDGFIKDDTTYMSVDDVLKIMKVMNLSAVWAKGSLVIGNPVPVDIPDVHTQASEQARVYVDGRQFAIVPCVSASDESRQQLITYLPVWYVMQGLSQLGQKNNWNGHQWNLDSSS